MFNKEYPHLVGYATVIDNKTKYAQKLIDDFSDPKKLPQIAISVDMLDTGIDVPEVLNLVFFKKVMSHAKFWQMIGRGTRLCPDLLDGEDKQKFYIFDFCRNFEFFRMGGNTESQRVVSLQTALFSVKAELALKLQGIDYQTDELIAFRQELVDDMVAKVQELNKENFAIHQHLKYVEMYADPERYTALTYEDVVMMQTEVAPLIQPYDGDIKETDRVLSNILMSYENDFAKHADPTDVPKIQLIWDSLPSQLARENKKFLYSAVKNGTRAREYEDALNWLYNADLVQKTFRISKPGLPLSAYDDLTAFKIYMSDVGLLRKHSHLATSTFAEYNRLFTEFKSTLTENFVLQSLSRQLETEPRYWADAPYKVDFVVQLDNDIIPVECKAGTNVKSTDLKKYSQQYAKQTPLMVRFSLMNLSLDGNLLNIPLFLVDRAGELIRLALAK